MITKRKTFFMIIAGFVEIMKCFAWRVNQLIIRGGLSYAYFLGKKTVYQIIKSGR